MTNEEREMHLGFMREALAMATYALTHSETPVGCVFVHSTPSSPPTIIGRGYNHTNLTFNGTRHAEFVAVNQILTTTIDPSSTPSSVPPPPLPNPPPLSLSPSPKSQSKANPKCPSSSTSGIAPVKRKYSTKIFKDCDLYVTVEPCIMCASFLRQLGIRNVFFGAANEKFGGTGGVLNIQRGNGRFDSFPEQGTNREGGGKIDGEGEGGELKRESAGEREGDGEGRREEGTGEREEGDYEVSGGWLREEAILLLRRFYVQENGRAPEEKRGKEGRVLRLDVD